jgi:ribonuclease R
MLRGERSGVQYQLAGRVRVKVVRVNLEQAKIDFVLVDPGGKSQPAQPAAPAKKKKEKGKR